MKKTEAKPLLKIGTVVEAMTTSFGGIKVTVTDVQTITSEKNKDTEFMYEFENAGEYIKVDEMTGDRLFEMKSKRCGVAITTTATLIQKAIEEVNEAQCYEQSMLTIQMMSRATDKQMNEIKMYIKKICEIENIETAHLIGIIRCDLESGRLINSVLKWLQTRIENYATRAGV